MIIDTPLWYKIWQHSGYNLTRAKQTSQETQKELTKVSGADEETKKVIYTDNSLESVKKCVELSWNHRTSTPHRSETNGIARYAE